MKLAFCDGYVRRRTSLVYWSLNWLI